MSNRHFHTGLTKHKHRGLYWLVTVYTAVARASQSGLPTDEGAQPSRTNPVSASKNSNVVLHYFFLPFAGGLTINDSVLENGPQLTKVCLGCCPHLLTRLIMYTMHLGSLFYGEKQAFLSRQTLTPIFSIWHYLVRMLVGPGQHPAFRVLVFTLWKQSNLRST